MPSVQKHDADENYYHHSSRARAASTPTDRVARALHDTCPRPPAARAQRDAILADPRFAVASDEGEGADAAG